MQVVDWYGTARSMARGRRLTVVSASAFAVSRAPGLEVLDALEQVDGHVEVVPAGVTGRGEPPSAPRTPRSPVG
ncbi:hypothetical protein GCM10010095_81330 [Streptomyces anthocyanicus]|nr:hypothetical protein GCM10010095_81330 [Streptomyces anthocyanicus]